MSYASESAREVERSNAKRMAEIRQMIHDAGLSDVFSEYMNIINLPNTAYSQRLAKEIAERYASV